MVAAALAAPGLLLPLKIHDAVVVVVVIVFILIIIIIIVIILIVIGSSSICIVLIVDMIMTAVYVVLVKRDSHLRTVVSSIEPSCNGSLWHWSSYLHHFIAKQLQTFTVFVIFCQDLP